MATTEPRRGITPSPVTLVTTAPPWPWSFTDRRGRVHAARDLPRDELLHWHARFAWAARTSARYCDSMRSQLIRRLFPWRLLYWWRGDPRACLLELPAAAQCAALADYFQRAGLPAPPFVPERLPCSAPPLK